MLTLMSEMSIPLIVISWASYSSFSVEGGGGGGISLALSTDCKLFSHMNWLVFWWLLGVRNGFGSHLKNLILPSGSLPEKSALMEEADTELSRLAQSQSYFGLSLWLIVVAVVSTVVVRW